MSLLILRLTVLRGLFLLLIVLSPVRGMAQSSFITLGTGDITGVYYPAGGAICRILNQDRDRHGIRCAVESTQGSTYNLNALRRGELNLAIVQPDWHYHAAMGSSIFTEQGADKELRTLFNLHNEDLTLVVRADSGIRTLADLKGKRVNLGSPESGQRRTMDLILNHLGWSYSDFKVASELSASEMAEALCSDRIDAFIYIVGHPNTSIAEATTFCNSRLIPLPQSLVDYFANRYPFYAASEIQGGLYRGNAQPTRTLQLTASLVTRSDLPDMIAYELAKAIYENFERFKEMHPALGEMSRDEAFSGSANMTPVHSGVRRFLQSVKTLP